MQQLSPWLPRGGSQSLSDPNCRKFGNIWITYGCGKWRCKLLHLLQITVSCRSPCDIIYKHICLVFRAVPLSFYLIHQDGSKYKTETGSYLCINTPWEMSNIKKYIWEMSNMYNVCICVCLFGISKMYFLYITLGTTKQKPVTMFTFFFNFTLKFKHHSTMFGALTLRKN